MGFFYGDDMGVVEKQGKGKPEEVTRQSLVKKAYRKVSKKLDSEKESSEAIDDLVKLLKADKDAGGEDESDVKEIKVRWESSKGESSSEG